MSTDLTERSVDEDARQRDLATETAYHQDQLRAVAVAKVRQKIIQHMPYPPFRDETLVALDEMLKVFGYFK